MNKIEAYLAIPYSHYDPEVKQWRYEQVTAAAAFLISKGFSSVYSPITHTHPVDRVMAVKSDHAFWVQKFDLPFLLNSKKLMILTLPGWELSTGIRLEMQTAQEAGIPIVMVEPIYNHMFKVVGVKFENT